MSETTEVKGQFGLGQSGGTGKKLKIYCFLQMFRTPPRNNKALQLQLINSFISSHDIACSCSNPGFHTLLITATKIGKELTKEEKNQIIQCLGDTTTTPEEEEEPDLGDLDALFAENGGEDDEG